MKSIKIKTTCNGSHVHTTLANPLAPLGDIRDSSVQIRQINNIPDDIDHYRVIKKWNETCDMTRIMTGTQRLEFDFSELGGGRKMGNAAEDVEIILTDQDIRGALEAIRVYCVNN